MYIYVRGVYSASVSTNFQSIFELLRQCGIFFLFFVSYKVCSSMMSQLCLFRIARVAVHYAV
jgi:hypothetical protein